MHGKVTTQHASQGSQSSMHGKVTKQHASQGSQSSMHSEVTKQQDAASEQQYRGPQAADKPVCCQYTDWAVWRPPQAQLQDLSSSPPDLMLTPATEQHSLAIGQHE